MEYDHDVDTMIQTKHLLLSMVKTDEIDEILKRVDQYLKKNCNHRIVNDLIDIDPDRSKSIQYCEHCLVTFV
jgi:flagellar motor switch protein FliG